MALLEVPVEEDGGRLLVEVNPQDIKGGLTLASQPGEAAAKAAQSLSKSLEQLQPIIRTVKEQLASSMPARFTVEFGVKLGGETGIILAKGTAEVNFTITMTWDRSSER